MGVLVGVIATTVPQFHLCINEVGLGLMTIGLKFITRIRQIIDNFSQVPYVRQ